MNTEQMATKIAKGLTNPSITVVGCGGAGCNVISKMSSGLSNVTSVAINTDATNLDKIEADKKLLIGKNITNCQGAEGNVELGKQCAIEAQSSIQNVLEGSDIVFVIAGMGGGTGTGAAPVIAETAQKMGSVVVGIVISPFSFERNRQQVAADGLSSLKSVASNVVVVDNDRLLHLAGDASFEESFNVINNFVGKIVAVISNKITTEIRSQVTAEVRDEMQIFLEPQGAEMPMRGVIPSILANPLPQ
ncbi:hypothetical protein [Candidatus Methanomassiliicoccus intestinalis]|uniref:hypothetical protein n=1 Tax=Candidatus Methanomassiliicoccus intestinalis TaxID=1406512 RepID=UPI0037DD375F